MVIQKTKDVLFCRKEPKDFCARAGGKGQAMASYRQPAEKQKSFASFLQKRRLFLEVLA
jgi:hypothetical protein